jgi:hypothetical protein
LDLQEIFEMKFRRVFAVIGALTLTASIAPAYAQYAQPEKGQEQPQQQRKLSNDERREYIALNELVDAVAAGKQPAPADLKLKFQNHFLKSNQNVYIPYILEISDGTFSSFPVTMYVRAVQKSPGGATGTSATVAKPGDKLGDKPADWPFADVYFLSEKNITTAGNAAQVARALELPPGEYTLYIAMRERQPRDKKQGPPKTVVLAHPLSVPDMNKGLTTSSVILANALDPAPEQLTGQQQLEQPFTISGYRVTPSFSPSIPQSGELLFVFFIYNEGVAASGKPDLDVEYHFFRAAEEKPFTRLATQSFNATTLPGQFDLKVGHQVFVGQGIPLKSDQMTFAPGDYRLEIRITDKTNGQAITRTVPFTVS